jgi:3-dehydroquinate dehydratase/shikimate dehydrogenase
VGLVELRLDRMASFDLETLIRAARHPLIVTCRPRREGGAFAGSERERLEILGRAASLGVAWVDVEWDAVEAFGAVRPAGPTRILVSRHVLDGPLPDPARELATLADGADAVKLVGRAFRPTDAAPMLRLLGSSPVPLVGLLMGEAGRPARLLAPAFASCLLTYVALSLDERTASGQPTLTEALDRYGLHQVGPHTRALLHLCADRHQAAAVEARNAASGSLHVPLVAPVAEWPSLRRAFEPVVAVVAATDSAIEPAEPAPCSSRP